jgi:hypothetical protein
MRFTGYSYSGFVIETQNGEAFRLLYHPFWTIEMIFNNGKRFIRLICKHAKNLD